MSASRARSKKDPAKNVLKSKTLRDLQKTKSKPPMEQVRQPADKYLDAEARFKELADGQLALACRIRVVEQENTREKNLVIESDRNRYIRKEVRRWRLRWFYAVLLGPAYWGIVFIYLDCQNRGSIHFTRVFIENNMTGYFFSSINALVLLIYSGFVVKNFADTYNKSSLNAFKSALEIPKDLQPLNEEE